MENLNGALTLMGTGIALVFGVMGLLAITTWATGKAFVSWEKRAKAKAKAQKAMVKAANEAKAKQKAAKAEPAGEGRGKVAEPQASAKGESVSTKKSKAGGEP